MNQLHRHASGFGITQAFEQRLCIRTDGRQRAFDLVTQRVGQGAALGPVKLIAVANVDVSVLQVERKIRGRVKRQMEKTQREYYLNEQLKAIQKELGEGEDGKDEVSEIEERIGKTKLTKEARDKAMAEVKKLRSMSPMSAEATESVIASSEVSAAMAGASPSTLTLPQTSGTITACRWPRASLAS